MLKGLIQVNSTALLQHFLCNLDNDEQDTRKTEERTSYDEKTPIERYIIAEKQRKIRTKKISDSATTRKKKKRNPSATSKIEEKVFCI